MYFIIFEFISFSFHLCVLYANTRRVTVICAADKCKNICSIQYLFIFFFLRGIFFLENIINAWSYFLTKKIDSISSIMYLLAARKTYEFQTDFINESITWRKIMLNAETLLKQILFFFFFCNRLSRLLNIVWILRIRVYCSTKMNCDYYIEKEPF